MKQFAVSVKFSNGSVDVRKLYASSENHAKLLAERFDVVVLSVQEI